MRNSKLHEYWSTFFLLHRCASDWEGSLIVIFHGFGDTWNPIPGSKLHEKENQLCKRMEESKAEYEATVQHINDLQQDVFASQLPKVQCIDLCSVTTLHKF